MKAYYKPYKSLLLGLLIFVWLGGKGQEFDNFHLLRSGSTVPIQLKDGLSKSILRDKGRSAKLKRKKKDKARQEQFFVSNSYMTDRLMRSGLVLFDDPVGEYLNRIKDYLLRDDDRNRERIHVYLVRSPEVNAFATASGDIFVHLGLMARLENEAVLAFVLSHEIQHVIRKHSFRQFEETEQMRKSIRKRKRKQEEDLQDFLKSKNLFSRKQESQADNMGLKLFLKSAYSPTAADLAMDLLKYSYLPFSNIPWDTTFFEFSSVDYPTGFVLDSIQEISAKENDGDENQTHPNILRRRQDLKKTLEKELDSGIEPGELNYLFGEELFVRIREICRFELCHAEVVLFQYPEAIWTAYSLLQDHPNNVFLNRMIGQALYRLGKFGAATGKSGVVRSSKEIQGASQELYHFLENLKENELNLLAMKYNWKCHLEYPEEETFLLICQDLAKVLTTSFPETLLKLEGLPNRLNAGLEPQKEDRKKTRKLRRIAEMDQSGQVAGKQKEEVRDFALAALKDEFGIGEFQVLFDSAMAGKARSESLAPPRIPKHGRRRISKGYNLGAERVVFTPVDYRFLDHRKAVPFQYEKSELVKAHYIEKLDEVAGLLDVDIVLLDYNSVDPTAMNNIGVLNMWRLDTKIGENFGGYVNLYHSDAVSLSSKHGTELFVWNSLNHERNRTDWNIATPSILFSILMFPMMPVAVWYAFKANHSVRYRNEVYNIVTGEKVMNEDRYIRKNLRTRMIKTTLFNTLYQIQKPPRNEK